MPGIVGLITKMPREWAEPQLLRMVEALRHESFYTTGTWADESSGVYVGWAERENSGSEAMPLGNQQGGVFLVFSGEQFPKSYSGRPKESGNGTAAEGTSGLTRLYERDPSFPASLNGRFHGLLVDRTRGTTTLFNDRYGMHRIYYHESKEAFYFSAEAKAILAVRPDLRTAEPRSLGELVACGCVLGNRTLFKGIHVLPCASRWVFRHASIEGKGTYFEPREWEEQAPLEPESYYSELRGVLSKSLPRYFNGKQRIGVSLTGGLDTRVIMAWWKAPEKSLPCYTFGGMFRDCQDVRVARRVARACGQSHEVIEVGTEFLSRFPHYAERSLYLSDGCVDVSRSPDLYLNEKAREIAPVRMVGTFGSEILCRLAMFKPVEPAVGLFRPEFLASIREAGATYNELRREHPVTFAAFRQSPWYHYGIVALEQTQLAVRTPFLDNDFVRTVFRAPILPGANHDLRERLVADGNPALSRIRTDRGIGGGSGGVAAAASHSFQEFTFKAEYAYDYGMPQWLAQIDGLLSSFHVERLFLGRHKLFHFRIWYRDRLSSYVQEVLLDPRTLSRPYLEPRAVEAVVRGHVKGNRNYTNEIHKLLSLELLHRLFFDAN